MRKYSLIPLVVIAAFSFGCQKASHMNILKQPEKPLIQYVESPKLAKLILRPPVKHFSIPRDPFKPIIAKEGLRGPTGLMDPSQMGVNDALNYVVLLGVVKCDNDYRALLKIHNKQVIFKLQDKIENYTVKDISANQIVFQSGDQQIIRKRGEI